MTQAVSEQQHTNKVTLTPYDAGGKCTSKHTNKVTLTPYDAGDEWTTNRHRTPSYTGSVPTLDTGLPLTRVVSLQTRNHIKYTSKLKHDRARSRCVRGPLTKCGVTFRLTYHQLALPPFSYLETSLHKS